MSLRPMFPQFAAACGEFVRPYGFPRPFAALDWCRRCGQPDWAHQRGSADRMARLSALDADDMSCALEYLAEYSPAALDAILDIISAFPITQDENSAEPYCTSCGAPLAIFFADGRGYRHYRQTGDGDLERYDSGHPPVIGWRHPTVI